MIKFINRIKLKLIKQTVIIGTSTFIGMHMSLPSNCTHEQLNQDIKNGIESFFLGDNESYTKILNSDDPSSYKNDLVEQRSIITVDMKLIKNLSNLKEFDNLSLIEICNAQRLSIEDINMINNSHVDEIYLKFNLEEMIRNYDNKFDFDCFKNKKVIKNITFEGTYNITDYEGVLFVNLFKNYKDFKFLDIDDYEKIDKKIDDIIKSIDYKPSDTDFDIILKNLYYVSNHIEYDEVVAKINSIKDRYQDTTEEERDYYDDYYSKYEENISYYNKKPLESITKDIDDVEKGVCVNYAALYSILCIKKGIPVFKVRGTFDSNGHAWNLYYPDEYNNPVYIDCTFLDNNKELCNVIENYLYDPSAVEYKRLVSAIYKLSKSSDSYKLDQSIDSYYNLPDANKDTIIGSQYVLDKRIVAMKTVAAYTAITLFFVLIKLSKKMIFLRKTIKAEEEEEKENINTQKKLSLQQ